MKTIARKQGRPVGWNLGSTVVALFLGYFCATAPAEAQPKPGDVFREYRWIPPGTDAGGSLRVGGRVGYDGGPVSWAAPIDLAGATKAEVVIEKLLCHDGTRGLAISANNNDWLGVAEMPLIPEPQWDYQHHVYPVVSIPLGHLESNGAPQFRLRVGDEHPWNWPQHLIYGVHLRVYYDPAVKPHPTGSIVAPKEGATLGEAVDLAVDASSPNGRIARVDFLGNYLGVNWEGDGNYAQWHHHYVRGDLKGTLAGLESAPWRFTWITSWIPDQPKAFSLGAWVTDETGLVYFTPAIKWLTFHRPGLSVELCKPYEVPQKWVTRSGEKTEKFDIRSDLTNAVAARLAWVSWSPGYMEGLSINGQKVIDREGPRYAYYAHQVPLEDLGVLRSGVNILTTGLTSKYDGKMVHGMEVNWPGIMVLIQYRTPVTP